MRNPFSCLIVLACSVVATAQVAPVMVNPSDTPLKIMSINSTLSDFLEGVVTKNVSGKQISSFQLGVVMAIPAACGPKETISTQKLMQADRIVLSPGATGQSYKYGFSPSDVQMFQTDNLGKSVHTQVTVVKVEFSDGTVWAFSHSGKMYDDTVMAKYAALQCSTTQQAQLARASALATVLQFRVEGK